MSLLKHLTGEDNPQSITLDQFMKLIPYNHVRDYCLAVVRHGLPLPEPVARRLNQVMENETYNQTTRRAWKTMVRLGIAEEVPDGTCAWCNGTGRRVTPHWSCQCQYCDKGRVTSYKYIGPVC